MVHLSYYVENLLEQTEKSEMNYSESLCLALQQEIAGLAFVERRENVILQGSPKVGKTRLAV